MTTPSAIDLTSPGLVESEDGLPELIVVIPTRGHPERVVPLLAAIQSTITARTRLVLAVDADDPFLTTYVDAAFHVPHGVDHAQAGISGDDARDAGLVLLSRNDDDPIVTIADNGSRAEAINRTALFFAWMSSAAAVAVLGDGALPRSRGWDSQLLDAVRTSGGGLATPNDLSSGEERPPHVVISTAAVRALGYVAPTPVEHLHLAEVWRLWGRGAGRYAVVHDAVVDHGHLTAHESGSSSELEHPHSDEERARALAHFREYVLTRLADDVRKIRETFSLSPKNSDDTSEDGH